MAPGDTVRTTQQGVHSALSQTVRRHLAAPWRKPLPNHSAAAISTLLARVRAGDRSLVLDSFCGTGMSTSLLARRHPGAIVAGVDRSAARLARHQAAPGNYLLLRAEAEAIWRGLVEAGIGLEHHYLLYPNPWPKARHLKRRVHGHGSFPLLLALGGRLELRSNWRTYVEEFSQALEIAGFQPRMEPLPSQPDLSLFERKYRSRGDSLWRCSCDLGAAATHEGRREIL